MTLAPSFTGGTTPGAIVVGTGYGVFAHVRALRASGFNVCGLVGRDPQKTQMRAQLLGIPHATTSMVDALAIPDVSLVSIATPPHTHRDLVIQAVRARKHVLCEKPFALDATQAREMLAEAEKAGVVHGFGVEHRFSPGHAHLRRALLSGDIGTPRQFLHVLHLDGLGASAAELTDWWSDASRGGGFLGAWGVHVIDQVRFMLGDFSSVYATMNTLCDRPNFTADDTFTLQFELLNGVTGVITCSIASPGQTLAATKVTGSKGSLWLQGNEVWIQNGEEPRRLPTPIDLEQPQCEPFPFPELIKTVNDRWHSTGHELVAYTKLFDHLREKLVGKPTSSTEAAATFRDAVVVQKIMDAAHLSASERRTVILDEVP